jgi:hypothetical protein
MRQGARVAVVAQSSGRQEALWHAALASQGFRVAAPRSVGAGTLDELLCPQPAVDLVVVDLRFLADHGVALDAAAAAVAAARPGALLAATLGDRLQVAEAERRWARRHGTLDLFPARTLSPLRGRAAEGLTRLLSALGGTLSVASHDAAMARLATEAAAIEGDPGAVLATRGLAIEEVAARLRGPAGVPVEDRRFHLSTYERCFVGIEAVDWLASNYGLARDLATSIGRLLQGLGWLHHVVKEQPFQDGHYFFRFAEDLHEVDAVDPDDVIAGMKAPGGLSIRDRSYLGRTHAGCFVGREAAEWLARRYGLGRSAAIGLGQRLVDLQLVRHVLDEHDFTDADYFYRFRSPLVSAAR